MSTGRPISEDDLHGFVDDALSPGRRAEVEGWLERNPGVAERVTRFREQRADLREALGPIAEEPIPADLNLAHLAARRRRHFPGFWRAAVAACVCLGVGGTAGWSLRGFDDPALRGPAAVAREAAVAFAVFGSDRNRPVEIRANESADLVRWISNRLRRPITVPDLSAAGYRFMGGRLVATAAGPAGMLMYDDDHGVRIAMLMRPMADSQARMSEVHEGELTGFAWADGRFGYGLVGDADAGRLHPVADEVRRQMRDAI